MPASSDPPADDANLPLSAPEMIFAPRSGSAKPIFAPRSGLGGEVIPGPAGAVTLSVTLPAGVALHARPAADLVRAASRLPVPVTIGANGKRANARSILEVLALGAVGGTELTLSATGPGAEEAVRVLGEVVSSLGG